MVEINKLEILDRGLQLAIDVQTQPGFNVTSLLFWSIDTFKDYTLAVDLSGKLEKINNREVLIINANELGLERIEDICFVEIESNYVEDPENPCDNCTKPVLGIVYELSKYYKCLIKYLLDSNDKRCSTCDATGDYSKTIMVNMLIDSIGKAVTAGYYTQAIDLIYDLRKICKLVDCKNCKTITCSTCNNFKQD